MSILKLNAAECFEKIKNKELSSEEVTSAYLGQIEKTNDTLNSFLTITKDIALETARKVDKKISQGEGLLPLEGVPIAIKDNICLKGHKTTCSSKILENFVTPYDATVIEKINNYGMPILGKTNLDEFAMGSSTENSAFGTSKNPWDITCVPGGSSGGSAVAVSGLQAPLALGSDTGGSIRQPASFCGTVGFKPTYGRVSRFGLIAFASSLDQIGTFSRTVKDTALLSNIICAHDPKDSTSQPLKNEDYSAILDKDIKGKKIGIPKQLFSESLSPEIKAKTLAFLKSSLDIKLLEIDLPSLDYALATYYIIAPAEASSNLSRYDGVRFGFRDTSADNLKDMMIQSRSKGFGKEVKRRILIGTYVLSSGYYDAYYKKAQKVRTLIKNDFNTAFSKVDFIVSPTTPTPAFKIGEKTDNPLDMYLSDIMTIPASMAGLPAISLPIDTSNNLPLGLQLIGSAFSEQNLLNFAYQCEKAANFHKKSRNQYWENA